MKKKEDEIKKDEKLNTAIFQDIQRGLAKEHSDFKEAVDILMNEKFKRRKTILDNRQVFTISVLDVISQLYDITFLKDWINYYAEWRTSGDSGKGRQDIVDIAKSHVMENQQQQQSFMDRIRGR
jgi:hypothetical protein